MMDTAVRMLVLAATAGAPATGGNAITTAPGYFLMAPGTAPTPATPPRTMAAC